MNIAYFFIVVSIVGLLLNFRRAVILLAPLHLILVMFNFPGMPVSPFEIISVLVLLFFFCTTKTSEWRGLLKYPFRIGVFVTIISIVGTNFFVVPHWPTASLRFISAYVYPIVLWSCIKDKDDFIFLVKSMTVFALVMAGYILCEVAIGRNPYIETIVANKWVNGNVIDYTEIRFGLKRCQGFLSTPAPSGLFFGLFSVVLYEVSSSLESARKYLAPMIGLMGLCMLLSGTRSVIAASCVAWIIVVKKEAFQAKYFIFKLVLVLGLLAVIGPYLYDILDSFLNTEKVHGSNADMRMEQMMITLLYWANSPIWGNGSGFVWDFVKEVNADIAGAESVWFQLLIDMGLVGVVAYLASVFSVVNVLRKLEKIWVFVPLGFLVGKSLSSVLGMEISFMFVLGVILLKYNELYVESDDEDCDESESNQPHEITKA